MAANRSEIAIRIFRAANELGLQTVAVYSKEDRLSLHRFKADEAYLVGEGKGPVEAYLDIAGIVALAKAKGVDAIHPGYGFLSENAAFARACAKAGITFVGPTPELLELLGDKTAARGLAIAAGVPVLPGTEKPVKSAGEARKIAAEIGYPVMVKAAMGGGGRGMRVVRDETELEARLEEAQSEARSAFGDASVFLEKFLARARHLEVQILGDSHGNLLHLYERDCSVQRRHQKVVEVAPAANLPASVRAELCDAAAQLARKSKYRNAGTVEFLYDVDSRKWYFIEVNPRIQVEHTVTEMVTGIDLVRAQILVAQGHSLHDETMRLPRQESVPLYGAALQCRVTTEDPEKNFAPDYGKISTYRSPAGFGIRLDGGTAYAGASLAPYYDSLLVKVTAWGTNLPEACQRKCGKSRKVPHRRSDDGISRRASGAVSFSEARRSCDEATYISGRRDSQREPGSQREAGSREHRSRENSDGIPCLLGCGAEGWHAATAAKTRAEKVRGVGEERKAAADHGHDVP